MKKGESRGEVVRMQKGRRKETGKKREKAGRKQEENRE